MQPVESGISSNVDSAYILELRDREGITPSSSAAGVSDNDDKRVEREVTPR